MAAAMLGWENVFHCEINPFGKRVLEYWFPNSVSYDDITKTDFTKWRGRIDVLTGGFPCQPFSYAGKGGGEKTSVISGRRCSALLTKSGPLGSLVRTLLESPRWSKEGYSLRWEARGLCSRRITSFTDTNSNSPSPSNESAETLNVQDIASSRCLFQLRLSELPTDETGSSSLPMLPTPRAMEVIESPENMVKRLQDRTVNSMPNLQSMAKFRPDLLPTPTAEEAEKYRLQYTPGSQMGTSLSAMGASVMLPTPQTSDCQEPLTPEQKERYVKKWMAKGIMPSAAYQLRQKAVEGMLPTPSARDWKGKTNPGIVKKGSGCVYGETLPDTIGRLTEASSPKTAGGTSRLSPLFTEEMMGFVLMWTTLPFLSPSGEPNP